MRDLECGLQKQPFGSAMKNRVLGKQVILFGKYQWQV